MGVTYSDFHGPQHVACVNRPLGLLETKKKLCAMNPHHVEARLVVPLVGVKHWQGKDYKYLGDYSENPMTAKPPVTT